MTRGTGRTAQHGRFSGAARVIPDGIRPSSCSEDEESLAGQKRASSQALGTIPKRRSSSRFIKRRKFDGELVESSLAKSSTRAKGASGVEPGCCSGSEPSSSEKKVSKAPSTPVPPSPSPAPGLTKHVKKSKQPLQVTKDLGRWKPADDLLLINAVLQTNDLTSVHLVVKFSCLHPAGSPGALDLLHRHPNAFYLARTAKALQAQWQLMKPYYLLEDQTAAAQGGPSAELLHRRGLD
ncbi:microspherule protein 1 isoform X1 [Pontoporia blainvillei]|uniref:Microspherule protein 1 isoform X1 n=1 Tax=Pontoporia blainvillei TaxID=48723 RepID=A0ABX0S045_PONBL|nr:microspherule protein 1 isoform X1 [Pontoporia blainvillei]